MEQLPEYNNHAIEVNVSSSHAVMPSADKSFVVPTDKTMPFDRWLQFVLKSNEALIQREYAYEVQVCLDGNHPRFYTKQVRWFSPSLYAHLEHYLYSSNPVLLPDKWKKRLASRMTLSSFLIEVLVKYALGVDVTYIKGGITGVLWLFSLFLSCTTRNKKSSKRTYTRDKNLVDQVRRFIGASELKRIYLEKYGDEKRWLDFWKESCNPVLNYTASYVKTNADISRKRKHERVENCLRVSSSTVVQIANALFSHVFDGDFRYETLSSDRLKLGSALCLLQLICGSRALGIMSSNVIRRFNKEVDINLFERANIDTKRLVVVTGITKQKTDEAKAAIKCRRLEKEGKDVSFQEMLRSTKLESMAVLRPLLFEFLRGPTETNVTDEQCIDRFFDLFYCVRVACEVKGVHAQTLRKCMTDVLVGVFQRCGYPVAGTHELRRLYACYGFHLLGSGMKEVDYVRRVLGHESFDVSLYYMSISIQ